MPIIIPLYSKRHILPFGMYGLCMVYVWSTITLLRGSAYRNVLFSFVNHGSRDHGGLRGRGPEVLDPPESKKK